MKFVEFHGNTQKKRNTNILFQVKILLDFSWSFHKSKSMYIAYIQVSSILKNYTATVAINFNILIRHAWQQKDVTNSPDKKPSL